MNLSSILLVWCASVLVGAEFVVRDARLRASEALPKSRTEVDGLIVNEISSCAFLGDGSLVLLADDSQLFRASLSVGEKSMKTKIQSGVELSATGYESVDAEGCAMVDDSRLFVSTEKNTEDSGRFSLLGIQEFDIETGSSLSSPLVFDVPEGYEEGVTEDEGFESLGISRNLTSDGKTYLLTTTEYRLEEDPPGTHGILAWDASIGGLPSHNFFYKATIDPITDIPYGVVDFESIPSSRTILVLERTFVRSIGNVIRLFEVELTGAGTSDENHRKSQIFEWSHNLLNVTSGNTYEIAVDNYEGLCFLPGSSTLLLVSDDDSRETKPGTQFVLLDLEIDGVLPYRSSTSSNQENDDDDLVWILIIPLLIALVVSFLLCRCLFCRNSQREEDENGGGVEMFAPSGERYRDKVEEEEDEEDDKVMVFMSPVIDDDLLFSEVKRTAMRKAQEAPRQCIYGKASKRKREEGVSSTTLTKRRSVQSERDSLRKELQARARVTARKVWFLNHALTCRDPSKCTLGPCKKAVELVAHMKSCGAVGDRRSGCKSPACVHAARLLHHPRSCTRPGCEVCALVRRAGSSGRGLLVPKDFVKKCAKPELDAKDDSPCVRDSEGFVIPAPPKSKKQ